MGLRSIHPLFNGERRFEKTGLCVYISNLMNSLHGFIAGDSFIECFNLTSCRSKLLTAAKTEASVLELNKHHGTKHFNKWFQKTYEFGKLGPTVLTLNKDTERCSNQIFVTHVHFINDRYDSESESDESVSQPTGRELIDLASHLAIFLKKIPAGEQLLEAWLYLGFMKRHRDICFLKPRSLSMSRAKSVTPESLDNYFKKLEDTPSKYNFHISPQHI